MCKTEISDVLDCCKRFELGNEIMYGSDRYLLGDRSRLTGWLGGAFVGWMVALSANRADEILSFSNERDIRISIALVVWFSLFGLFARQGVGVMASIASLLFSGLFSCGFWMVSYTFVFIDSGLVLPDDYWFHFSMIFFLPTTFLYFRLRFSRDFQYVENMKDGGGKAEIQKKGKEIASGVITVVGLVLTTVGTIATIWPVIAEHIRNFAAYLNAL